MGFWCFCNPPGLRFIKDPIYGKVLINNELLSPIFKEAIEGYTSNYLNTYEEVREFIQQKYKEKNIIRPLSIRGTVAILTCVLYAGYVEYIEWGVERRKGHHDGFISLETFNAVREKMRSKSKKKLRADYSLDFPLRRFLVCTNCQRELTGSFNTGRNKIRYAHYWCKTDGCIFKYKSIKTGSVAKQFEELLLRVKPHEDVLNLTNVVFKKVWERQINNYEATQNTHRIEYNGIEDQIIGYMERINKTEKQEMVRLYESKVSELLKRKEDLEKAINTNPYTQNKFGTALNKVTETLNNPITTWKSENLTDKQNIVYMFFDGKLPYDYQNGFGNTTLEPVINLLNQTQPYENPMVEMRGIEPLC
jgi:site-specific DNA recombinase